MIPAAPFSLDARQIPEVQDLTGAAGDDGAQVAVLVTELLPADVITKVVFTAKVSPADGDGAPSTIQYIYPTNSSVTVVASATISGAFLVMATLLPADWVKIELTPYLYDVAVYVTRNAVLHRRTVQNGKLTAITNIGDVVS